MSPNLLSEFLLMAFIKPITIKLNIVVTIMNIENELRRIFSKGIPRWVKKMTEKKKTSNPNCRTILFIVSVFFSYGSANSIPPEVY
jgi:hypothetical protein